MNSSQKRFWLILALVLAALFVSLPAEFKLWNFNFRRPPLNLKIGSISFQRSLEPKFGLDLAGGTQVVLEADLSGIEDKDKTTAFTSAQEVISRRVDLFGVSEPNVYSQKIGESHQIVVELPGLEDRDQALNLIGQTAKLTFAAPVYDEPASPGAQPQLIGFDPSDLTGADLKSAALTFETEDRRPAVAIVFKDSGKDKFGQLTAEYLNKPLAIILDDLILSQPVVQTEILTGEALITGSFSVEEAKTLAAQLNAGALPVPIKVVSQNNIAPTLGQTSINKSLKAGLVGLGLVAIFMILIYRFLGVIAVLGLIVYGLITLSLYKLIPITLTLPGTAGFILSIGMAVDSNILIFERLKEELKNNRPWQTALELGFGRAWDSIKDANMATLITAFILFNPLNWSFLNTSGPVRGFALTLSLGILTSLFTGIFVTRTLLRLLYQGPRTKK